jgi:hypothetical protein
MVARVIGMTHWEAERTDEGHRDYHVKWRVATSDPLDGPQVVSFAPELPAVGSWWGQNGKMGNEYDVWAFCWPDWKITPLTNTGEQDNYWQVEQTFSTRKLRRCQDVSPQNPLLEPTKIRGTFTKRTEEMQADYQGKPILSSSWEPLKGKAVERDRSLPTVNITRNVLTLPLLNFTSMIDTLNDRYLWGLPPRCVKLSNATWERHLYGVCTYYYTVSYDFEINFNTFDFTALDQGTKVLMKGGDKNNPKHFALNSDLMDNRSPILLDGEGNAWKGPDDPAHPTPGKITIKKYDVSNLLLLGIPTTLGS